jgi:Ca-activated chloride channel family protein
MLSFAKRFIHRRAVVLIGLLAVALVLALLLGRWLAVIQAPLTRHAVGQNLLASGAADQAADAAYVFEEPLWQGIALYRAGRYHRAVGAFFTDDSLTGLYNMGNAYAHLGLYEGAIAAYETVLQRQPTHEDAFYNLELVRAAAERARELEEESRQTENAGNWEDGLVEDPQTADPETAQQQEGGEGDNSEASDPAADDQGQEATSASSTEAAAAEPQSSGNQAGGSEREGEQAEATTFSLTSGDEQENGDLSPESQDLEDMQVLGGKVDRALEEAMADEILLRRIEDDPSLVLKARLAMALRKQKARR